VAVRARQVAIHGPSTFSLRRPAVKHNGWQITTKRLRRSVPVCPPRQIMDGRSHTHCSRANLPAWHSLPAWQLRRSICTPRAGNCSAAPSSHPHVRNNHCSIWCRASRCTGSPRVHTCLFRVALPFRAPFRQLGNLGAQPFCGDATLGPEHLNGRCAFILRRSRLSTAGLTADVHSGRRLVHSLGYCGLGTACSVMPTVPVGTGVTGRERSAAEARSAAGLLTPMCEVRLGRISVQGGS
jgi:hypothetical protein